MELIIWHLPSVLRVLPALSSRLSRHDGREVTQDAAAEAALDLKRHISPLVAIWEIV